MKIMLDCSPTKIHEYIARYQHDFWQLRTPLTRYALSGQPYGLDNGCFTTFHERRWMKLLDDAKKAAPKFVCLPDIVGDARRTLELFSKFQDITVGLPRALVLQDGIGQLPIPWNDLDAVFVGGSDAFKVSPEAIAACKTAKILKKWVHVGRVNTAGRAANWMDLADSLDGSGISRYDHMLEDVLRVIENIELARQADLFLRPEDNPPPISLSTWYRANRQATEQSTGKALPEKDTIR